MAALHSCQVGIDRPGVQLQSSFPVLCSFVAVAAPFLPATAAMTSAATYSSGCKC